MVINVDTEDLSAVQSAAESQGTAAAIRTNLHELDGYDAASPARAEASVRVHTITIHTITIHKTTILYIINSIYVQLSYAFNLSIPSLLQLSLFYTNINFYSYTHTHSYTYINTLQVSDVEIATLSVITFTQCIDGVSEEDAETDSFQATLVAAVSSQIQSDTEEEHTVLVTGVSLDGTCGGPVVRYEVEDVCPSHLDTLITSLETRAMAGVIATQLHDAGFNGAEVEPADAQVETAQVVSHYEVVEYTQDLQGVTAIEAKSDAFKDSFKKSIAAQFGGYRMMDADNIDILSVTIVSR